MLRSPHRPAILIGLSALPVLILLALYPFLVVVRQSFGEPVTLAYWRSLLFGQATSAVPFWSPRHSLALLWSPLQHSLVVAGLTTILATALGTGLAWLSTMTDLRYTRLVRAVAMLHLILPPFALAIAWLSLARGLRLSENWTYGPLPMILVLTLHFYAFALLLVGAACHNLDAALIDAAQVHGAPNYQILLRIALPLLWPAVLASAGFIAFSSLAAFAPMQILGGGRQPYYVLATQVYSLYRHSLGDPRVGFFAVGLALVLTAISIPPFLFFLKVLNRDRNSWAVVGGRGHRLWQVCLGPWREPLSLLCVSLSLLTVLLPLGVLLLQSLSASPALSFDPAGLTLSHYRAIFLTNQYGLSLANSVLLATITATAGVLLTLPVAYSVQRSQLWLLRTALYLLIFLPFLLPGVVLGLTYFILISSSYRLGSLQLSLHFLYNSLLLAVVVSLVKHLPLGVQSHLNALLQVDPSLEEAAYVFRASFRRVLRRIFLPLVRPGSLVAWLLLFIFVFKEIDILAFVYAPLAFSTGSLSLTQFTRTPPIMYRIFTMINSEQYPELYAQGTALLLLTCLILLAVILLVVRLGWRPSVLTTPPRVTGPRDEPHG